MQVKPFVVNAFGVNCYVVYHQGEAIVVDPGSPSEDVLAFVEREGLRVVAIINTHGHADHIGGNAWFVEKTRAPLYIHELEAAYLSDPALHLGSLINQEVAAIKASRLLKDGDAIMVGGVCMGVIHTPGHSVGGISLYAPGVLLSGDTLFKGSVGRWDFPLSDGEALRKSLLRLSQLPPETKVYPGHGPSSTIARELETNPFLISLKDVE